MTLAALTALALAYNLAIVVDGAEVLVDVSNASTDDSVNFRTTAIDSGARYLGQNVGGVLPMGAGKIAGSRVYRFAA